MPKFIQAVVAAVERDTPEAMLMGPKGRIAPLLLAISPRVAETIALWSSGREDRKAKPSATTHVERGDHARVICSKR